MVESSGSIHLTHRSPQRKLHIKQRLNSSMKCSMNVREAQKLNRSFSCGDLLLSSKQSEEKCLDIFLIRGLRKPVSIFWDFLFILFFFLDL